MAFDVAERIESKTGKSVAVVSVHSLKPLDEEGIAKTLARFPVVGVIEEHAPYGGLGPRVKAIAFDSGARCALRSFALQDQFIHTYGSHAELLKAHGLDPDRIAGELLKLMAK